MLIDRSTDRQIDRSTIRLEKLQQQLKLAIDLSAPCEWHCLCGPGSAPQFQQMRFVESASTRDRKSTAAWTEDSFADQWHVAMYVEDFTGTYERFQAHPRVTHWDNPRIKDYADTLEKALARQQFRFNSIIDLGSGEVLLELARHLLDLGNVNGAATYFGQLLAQQPGLSASSQCDAILSPTILTYAHLLPTSVALVSPCCQSC